MERLRCTLVVIFLSVISISFAQRGKDGNGTISTTSRIVNEYTALTADVPAGSTSIGVLASGLNANNRFSGTLSAGDLIMIIQMQGATILGLPDAGNPAISSPNDFTWGGITNYNNCGNYEFCQVSGVPDAATITIDCGLVHGYTASGKVQIVRIPRYNTLHISSGGVLTCSAWNGSVGGVLSVEVLGNTSISSGGKVNVKGTGFRGGALFVPTNPVETVLYSCSNTNVGTNKGEGIAGFGADYTSFGGKYCRGAAANAGGGGNVWNCGGGGGANAGTLTSWNGQGNPDNSGTGWTTAWELESPGFSGSASSGGGRGGYSFSSSNQNATALGPGTLGTTNAWGGSFRYNLWGLGGRPLDYSTGKIFMGGGGGAGEQDNNQSGAGANGGGIVYFMSYGTITGSGSDSIIANGANGGNSQATPPTSSYSGKDGAGGGGGGGTILLNAASVSGLILTASGGNGGNQIMEKGLLYFGAINEAEGPGGGGGGGYIAYSVGSVSQIVNGGINGVTNSEGVTEFLPNGATKGGAGLANQTIIVDNTLSAGNVTMCSGNSTTLTASINGGNPATINWYSDSSGGAILATGALFTTPVLSATTVFYVGLCPGTYRIPVTVTVQPSVVPIISIAPNPMGTVCPGTSVTFTATSTNEGTSPVYQWQLNGVDVGTNSPGYTNSTFATGDSVKCILLSNAACLSGSNASTSNALVLAVQANNIVAGVSITANPTGIICPGTPVTFTALPVYGGAVPGYQWQVNGVNAGTNSSAFTSSALNNGEVVTCTMTSDLSCATGSPATSNSIIITTQTSVIATVNIIQNPLGTLCSGTPITFAALPTNGGITPGYQWQVNGVNAGSDSSIFTSSTFNNGDTVICIMTSSASCPIGSPAISNSMIMMIQASAIASVSITPNPAGTICSGTMVTFTSTSTNGGNSPIYQWQVNGINVGTNSTTYSSSNLNNGDVITCSMTSNANCVTGSPASSNTLVESVNQIPVPDFITNTTSGCAPLCVQFNEAGNTNCNSLIYYFGDGNSSITPSPQHCYTTAGTFSISVSCTSNNCTGTSSHANMITISSDPVANFTSDNVDIALSNTMVTFTDASTNGGSQSWNFGDPLSGGANISSLPSASHTYSDSGTYCVTLISTNANTCVDTAIKCFSVLDDATIVVPNVFTPNGDGKNDVFVISAKGVSELVCSVYNRWGWKVKEWDSISEGWDGRTANAASAPDGVYYYFVKAIAINGKVINKQGFIQLLREK